MLINKVKQMLDNYKMVEAGEGIVVGFSGGPDSVCLLYALNTLKQEYGLSLYAVHLNHMIRGEEALRDEAFAREFSKNLGVPFFCERIKVEEYGRENGLSSEEAGRFLRYQLFQRVREQTGSSKIALAHNMNDQTETVIMRFLRGTGIGGLGGIRPIRDGIYIRPILNCTRTEIEEYCRDNFLRPVIDSTNAETIYTRNKIRLKVIPYIKSNFNPNIDESIYRASAIIRDEDDYLFTNARQQLINLKTSRGVDVALFNELNIAVKRRIIRLLIEEVKGNLNGIEIKHVEDCVEFIGTLGTGRRICLPEGLICKLEYGCFSIVNSSSIEAMDEFCYELKIPGETLVNNKKRVITKIYELNNKNLIDKQFVKYFDYDKIKYGLHFRNRRDGDYIYPKGMAGSKKLKEIFIDKKIPKEIREATSLIACQSEILWVLQMRDTRNFKIDKNTKHILEISIEGGSLNELGN